MRVRVTEVRAGDVIEIGGTPQIVMYDAWKRNPTDVVIEFGPARLVIDGKCSIEVTR